MIRSLGVALPQLADVFSSLNPDACLILGDRYEMLGVSTICTLKRIPIFHVSGGDVSLGSYDDVIRHAITKMADLHLVTNSQSYQRVVQMGEDPRKVFLTGSTVVDNIRNLKPTDIHTLQSDLGLELGGPIAVVTFHPVTRLSEAESETEYRSLLSALHRLLGSQIGSIVFTGSNADNGSRILSGLTRDFVSEHDSAFQVLSLGSESYLELLSLASVCIGNSSSGIIEAPYLMTPSVDVGIRQNGRSRPDSVLHADPDPRQIEDAIVAALEFNSWPVKLIYGEDPAAPKVVAAIKTWFLELQFLEDGFHYILPHD